MLFDTSKSRLAWFSASVNRPTSSPTLNFLLGERAVKGRRQVLYDGRSVGGDPGRHREVHIRRVWPTRPSGMKFKETLRMRPALVVLQPIRNKVVR
jgi:hypothetical protein